MSWDAYLIDDRGHSDGEWGYTHNTNDMANQILCDGEALKRADEWVEKSADWWKRRDRPDVAEKYRENGRVSWWQILDTMTGAEGAAFLDLIIKGLEEDPDRFRARNPENGWGNYDDFLKVLTEMRNAVPEWPTVWSTSG